MTPPESQAPPRFVPTSTYRLQIHGGFPLAQAAGIVPYLDRLGAGAVYSSPYFAAEPGSTHGYDVTNHNEINPEAGGRDGYRVFSAAIRAAGLQHIVDFVPNHMGISTETNPWWRDVLEFGPQAKTGNFFDIDWNPVKRELRRKLLLPILGDQYGQVLERGELKLIFENGRLLLQDFSHKLPVNVRGDARLSGIGGLPSGKRDAILAEMNGTPGQPRSFDALHDLLEEQAYRLAYWRTASHEINYRRFFDVNTLAGLRVEDPEVFAAIHLLLGSLLRDGHVTGVRIDHPDGLFNPARYFEMLQDLAAEAWGISRAPGMKPLYVVAEKILSGRERLPPGWAVHGTTGYNFLNQVNALFVDESNARRMRQVYGRATGQTRSFDDILYETKRLIMDTSMASELNVLAHMLDRIGESNRRSRDFTLNSLRDVITEVVACFPIYRTYVDDNGWNAGDRESVARAIVRARRRNPAMDPTIFDFFREVVLPRGAEDSTLAVVNERRGGYPPADAEESAARLRFSMKFQQYTGPLQAKGLEDTAFYRYNVLLSLNEVGGDPSRFGLTAQGFHDLNRERRLDWPYEMLATATHDTKLGEDVRTRIDVLSELPEEWGREVARWMRVNRDHRTVVDGEPAPDRNDEYRFYQVLAGVWPFVEGDPAELVERLQAYMTKAVKEAKLHSSWINPNEAYEQAVTAFVARVLTGEGAAEFLPMFRPFQQRVAACGLINSLSQVALKIASPGVPDFYQGTELWDLSLVDPDNRRPVDYPARAAALERVDAVLNMDTAAREPALRKMIDDRADGAIKLLITAAGLRARRADADLFLDGDYVPLEVQSTVPGQVLAFLRTRNVDGRPHVALVVAPYLVARLIDPAHPLPCGDVWKTSRIVLPPELANLTFRDVFTGAERKPVSAGGAIFFFVGQLLSTLPTTLLIA